MGKPVIVGPHTFNFEEATQLAINAGAAVQIGDVEELGQAIAELLADAERRGLMGQAGLALMGQHQGAAQRIVAMLQEISRR